MDFVIEVIDMKTTTDYKFEVSLSEKGYDHKPDRNKEIPYLHFTKKTVDVNEFLDYMLEGHCYTGVYSFDSFEIGQKDNDNYLYSYLVTIDVDHSSETMNELVDRIEFKPTFAYTTSRDGLNGESRFRLVYAFDDKIEGKKDYYNLVYSILIANGVDIEKEVGNRDKKYDKKSEDAIQFYIGNGTETFDFAVTDIIYSKTDFIIYYKDYYILYTNNNINNKDNKSIIENYINKQHPHNNIHLNDTFEDKEFENDYWNMKDDGELLYKYINVFPNMEHTPLPEVDDDTPYIIYPKDYIEINRVTKVGDKYIRMSEGSKLKIKDGQGRARTLFWNGVIRRLINPMITFDNLLYNLLYEFYHYMTNYKAENIIGRREIYNAARAVMKADLSKYEYLRNRPHKGYTTNPDYCAKRNLSRNKVKGGGRKLKKYQQIGELYDHSKTIKENVEIMQAYGIKQISEPTLKRWMKVNGVTKYKKKAK